MKFNVAANLTYEIQAPTTLILNIHAARSTHQAVLRPLTLNLILRRKNC